VLGAVSFSAAILAFVMLKMRSTPNETPTQGTWALPENMPTRPSYLPPAATLPTPTLGSLDRSSSSLPPLLFLGLTVGSLAPGVAEGAEPSVTTS
jgi:hypothetical protein